MSRAAAFVFGASVAFAGCANTGGSTDATSDGAGDASQSQGDSATDTPVAADTPATNDSGPSDDGAVMALYGTGPGPTPDQ
jgi:hypothetical protein